MEGWPLCFAGRYVQEEVVGIGILEGEAIKGPLTGLRGRGFLIGETFVVCCWARRRIGALFVESRSWDLEEAKFP